MFAKQTIHETEGFNSCRRQFTTALPSIHCLLNSNLFNKYHPGNIHGWHDSPKAYKGTQAVNLINYGLFYMLNRVPYFGIGKNDSELRNRMPPGKHSRVARQPEGVQRYHAVRLINYGLFLHPKIIRVLQDHILISLSSPNQGMDL